MPVVRPSNNRILPANSRAADVARKALTDLVPLQQLKFENAFKVAGFECVLYSRLDQGRPCSCAASGAAIASRLNEDGKLSNGDINKLITGGYEFKVQPYGTRRGNTKQWLAEEADRLGTSIITPSRADSTIWETDDPTGEGQPLPFEKIGRTEDDPSVKTIEPDGDAFGANGPVLSAEDLAEFEASAFEVDSVNIGNASCPVCMGTGYIGGVVLQGGWRYICTPQDKDMLADGTIDTLRRPLVLEDCTTARWTLTLPKGAVVLDSLRVWNLNRIVPAQFVIDTTPISNERDFLNMCDGASHTVTVFFSEPVKFTHVEIQAALSTKLIRLEFPRLGQSTDLTKLDQTEDVQIILSPEIPIIRRLDLISVPSYNKTFAVTTVQLWNEDQRRVLGWDVSARVVQPQELYSLLPRRRIVKQQTTLVPRDNFNQGNKRT